MSATSTERMQLIAEAILGDVGELDPDVRQAIFDRSASHAYAMPPDHSPFPEALEKLTDLVSTQVYKVDDSHIAQLRAEGFSEDAILEAILSAAVSAGASRFSIGLAALHARR